MASVSHGVIRGCGGLICYLGGLSSFSNLVLFWLDGAGWTTETDRQMQCFWDPWRHNPDVSGILWPDNDPATYPPGYLSLAMTGLENWGSPSCLQRLPPPVWGLALVSCASASFDWSREALWVLPHMSKSKITWSRAWAELPPCPQSWAHPGRPRGIRGRPIKVSFSFLKNAGKKKWWRRVLSKSGERPWGGDGDGSGRGN